MKTFDVYPIFDIEIAKAKGSYLWDKAGKKYLDMYGGHAVISIGHSHPHYVKSIANQLENIGFYSNSLKISQQDILAEKLGKLSGCEEYQLFLCNSGAEANENAFKAASFYNGRKKIIAFSQAFHGRTSLAVAATDNKGIVAPVNETSNIVFLPFNDISRFEEEMNEEVCAVIVEGVQGVGGVNIPTKEFLQSIQKKCEDFGAIFIMDEIQSGYGRTGKFFAFQHAEVQPDIITTAKGMGNGFPVAGVLLHPKIQPKMGMLGTTFGGNYLACASAQAVLDVIDDEKLIENAHQQGEYFKNQLKGLSKIKEIRGLGLMIGIELFEDAGPIRNKLLFNYSIFTGSASNKNTIRILPSLAVTQEEMDILIKALKELLA